jgi:DNA invertase Pin-like site-specific DNA recombinase
MLVGYVRTSPLDQTPGEQVAALEAAGCSKIFADENVSASALRRPGLDRALGLLSKGDVLVVWQLARLGRSLTHLISLINRLSAKGIGFRSVCEDIDTASEDGKRFLAHLAALAEFERALVSERTTLGSAQARQRGVKAGRKPKLTPDKIEKAQRLLDQGESPSDVARSVDVSIATLYRHMPAAASNRTTFDLFSGSSS